MNRALSLAMVTPLETILGWMLAVSVAANLLLGFLAIWVSRNVILVLTEPL